MVKIDFHNPEFVKRYIKKNGMLFKAMKEEIARLLENTSLDGKRVLEVGCGTGYLCFEIANMFPEAEILGTDLSEAFISHANRIKELENFDNVQFEPADALYLPYDDNSFDFVFSFFTAHWVEEPVRYLREMERVLKPDGILIAGDTRYRFVLSFIPGFKTAFKLKKAKEIIGRAGIREHKFTSGFWYWRIDNLPIS